MKLKKNIFKAGVIVTLAFFASCSENNPNENIVDKIIVIGTDTVKLNKYGQVIQH